MNLCLNIKYQIILKGRHSFRRKRSSVFHTTHVSNMCFRFFNDNLIRIIWMKRASAESLRRLCNLTAMGWHWKDWKISIIYSIELKIIDRSCIALVGVAFKLLDKTVNVFKFWFYFLRKTNIETFSLDIYLDWDKLLAMINWSLPERTNDLLYYDSYYFDWTNNNESRIFIRYSYVIFVQMKFCLFLVMFFSVYTYTSECNKNLNLTRKIIWSLVKQSLLLFDTTEDVVCSKRVTLTLFVRALHYFRFTIANYLK